MFIQGVLALLTLTGFECSPLGASCVALGFMHEVAGTLVFASGFTPVWRSSPRECASSQLILTRIATAGRLCYRVLRLKSWLAFTKVGSKHFALLKTASWLTDQFCFVHQHDCVIASTTRRSDHLSNT